MDVNRFLLRSLHLNLLQGWYVADSVFSRGPYPTSGAADSIFLSDHQAADDTQRLAGRDELFVTSDSFASSLRLVVDMADSDRFYVRASTGQASGMGSKWYGLGALSDWSQPSAQADAVCFSAECLSGGSMRSQYCSEKNAASRFPSSGCGEEKSEL